MKQIQEFNCEIAFNGGEYHNISVFYNFRYVEPQEDKIKIITDWNAFYNEVAKGNIPRCWIYKTLFRHIPYVKYTHPWRDWCYKITKENFEKVEIKKNYKPTKRDFTFAELQEVLPADDFCEWLKDKNVLEIFKKTLDK